MQASTLTLGVTMKLAHEYHERLLRLVIFSLRTPNAKRLKYNDHIKIPSQAPVVSFKNFPVPQSHAANPEGAGRQLASRQSTSTHAPLPEEKEVNITNTSYNNFPRKRI
jgi:hypothetical protein